MSFQAYNFLYVSSFETVRKNAQKMPSTDFDGFFGFSTFFSVFRRISTELPAEKMSKP